MTIDIDAILKRIKKGEVKAHDHDNLANHLKDNSNDAGKVVAEMYKVMLDEKTDKAKFNNAYLAAQIAHIHLKKKDVNQIDSGSIENFINRLHQYKEGTGASQNKKIEQFAAVPYIQILADLKAKDFDFSSLKKGPREHIETLNIKAQKITAGTIKIYNQIEREHKNYAEAFKQGRLVFEKGLPLVLTTKEKEATNNKSNTNEVTNGKSKNNPKQRAKTEGENTSGDKKSTQAFLNPIKITEADLVDRSRKEVVLRSLCANLGIHSHLITRIVESTDEKPRWLSDYAGSVWDRLKKRDDYGLSQKMIAMLHEQAKKIEVTTDLEDLNAKIQAAVTNFITKAGARQLVNENFRGENWENPAKIEEDAKERGMALMRNGLQSGYGWQQQIFDAIDDDRDYIKDLNKDATGEKVFESNPLKLFKNTCIAVGAGFVPLAVIGLFTPMGPFIAAYATIALGMLVTTAVVTTVNLVVNGIIKLGKALGELFKLLGKMTVALGTGVLMAATASVQVVSSIVAVPAVALGVARYNKGKDEEKKVTFGQALSAIYSAPHNFISKGAGFLIKSFDNVAEKTVSVKDSSKFANTKDLENLLKDKYNHKIQPKAALANTKDGIGQTSVERSTSKPALGSPQANLAAVLNGKGAAAEKGNTENKNTNLSTASENYNAGEKNPITNTGAPNPPPQFNSLPQPNTSPQNNNNSDENKGFSEGNEGKAVNHLDDMYSGKTKNLDSNTSDTKNSEKGQDNKELDGERVKRDAKQGAARNVNKAAASSAVYSDHQNEFDGVSSLFKEPALGKSDQKINVAPDDKNSLEQKDGFDSNSNGYQTWGSGATDDYRMQNNQKRSNENSLSGNGDDKGLEKDANGSSSSFKSLVEDGGEGSRGSLPYSVGPDDNMSVASSQILGTGPSGADHQYGHVPEGRGNPDTPIPKKQIQGGDGENHYTTMPRAGNDQEAQNKDNNQTSRKKQYDTGPSSEGIPNQYVALTNAQQGSGKLQNGYGPLNQTAKGASDYAQNEYAPISLPDGDGFNIKESTMEQYINYLLENKIQVNNDILDELIKKPKGAQSGYRQFHGGNYDEMNMIDQIIGILGDNAYKDKGKIIEINKHIVPEAKIGSYAKAGGGPGNGTLSGGTLENNKEVGDELKAFNELANLDDGSGNEKLTDPPGKSTPGYGVSPGDPLTDDEKETIYALKNAQKNGYVAIPTGSLERFTNNGEYNAIPAEPARSVTKNGKDSADLGALSQSLGRSADFAKKKDNRNGQLQPDKTPPRPDKEDKSRSVD